MLRLPSLDLLLAEDDWGLDLAQPAARPSSAAPARGVLPLPLPARQPGCSSSCDPYSRSNLLQAPLGSASSAQAAFHAPAGTRHKPPGQPQQQHQPQQQAPVLDLDDLLRPQACILLPEEECAAAVAAELPQPAGYAPAVQPPRPWGLQQWLEAAAAAPGAPEPGRAAAFQQYQGGASWRQPGPNLSHSSWSTDETIEVEDGPSFWPTATPVSPQFSTLDPAAAARPALHTARRSPWPGQPAARGPQPPAVGRPAGPHAAPAAAGAAKSGGRPPRRAAALRSQASWSRADPGAAKDEEDCEEWMQQLGEGGSDSGSEGMEPLNPACHQRLGPQQEAARKKHRPWTQDETEALIEGVRLVGPGKWAEIKKLPLPSVSGVLAARSAVDLKDKWRNLSRVARLPKSALKNRLNKGGSETPLELVLAVKELLHKRGGRPEPEPREWL